MTHPYSSVPYSYGRVLSSLLRFRQMTTSQVRRLHFAEGTERGRIIRTQRCLARLVELELIVETRKRAHGGYGGGSGENVYQLPFITGANQCAITTSHPLHLHH